MPLTDEELKDLHAKMAQAGLPAVFQGDRLDAFQFGMDTVVRILQAPPKPEPPKED